MEILKSDMWFSDECHWISIKCIKDLWWQSQALNVENVVWNAIWWVYGSKILFTAMQTGHEQLSNVCKSACFGF